MQTSSSANAKDASILLGRYTCQRYTHLFIAIDKFTKWIEAKPVTTITAAKAKEFFQDIVVRFGDPNRIITYNGTQFTGSEFKDWCEELSIRIC